VTTNEDGGSAESDALADEIVRLVDERGERRRSGMTPLPKPARRVEVLAPGYRIIAVGTLLVSVPLWLALVVMFVTGRLPLTTFLVAVAAIVAAWVHGMATMALGSGRCD
jgi:hypothetical protein